MVTGVLLAVDEFALIVRPHPIRRSEDEASTARLALIKKVLVGRDATLTAQNGGGDASNLIVRHRPMQHA